MKKGKLLLALILCGILLVLLCGCVESFSVTQYVDKGGSRHFEYLATYDPAGVSAAETKAEVKAVMERYVSSRSLGKYATIDDSVEGQVCLEVIFPTEEEYEIWLGLTGREAGEINTPAKKGFLNAYDYTIDSYLTEAAVEKVRDLADEGYKDFPLSADFYYTYGTTSRSAISNGTRTEKDGVYYHTWKLDPEEPVDMTVRAYGINIVLFYTLVISIFVLSLATIFVIIYINKRKDKRRAATAVGEIPVLGEESPRETEQTKE